MPSFSVSPGFATGELQGRQRLGVFQRASTACAAPCPQTVRGYPPCRASPSHPPFAPANSRADSASAFFSSASTALAAPSLPRILRISALPSFSVSPGFAPANSGPTAPRRCPPRPSRQAILRCACRYHRTPRATAQSRRHGFGHQVPGSSRRASFGSGASVSSLLLPADPVGFPPRGSVLAPERTGPTQVDAD